MTNTEFSLRSFLADKLVRLALLILNLAARIAPWIIQADEG